jgi:hypothetical protein
LKTGRKPLERRISAARKPERPAIIDQRAPKTRPAPPKAAKARVLKRAPPGLQAASPMRPLALGIEAKRGPAISGVGASRALT